MLVAHVQLGGGGGGGGGAHLPEPLYLLAVAGIVPVGRTLLPLTDIQVLHATQHQLWQREARIEAGRAPVIYLTHTHEYMHT